MKSKQRTDADRLADRDRKRAQRLRDFEILEDLRESTMDDGQKRVRRIMAAIALEPRQPRKVIA